MRKKISILLIVLITCISCRTLAQQPSWQLYIDLKKHAGPLAPIWASFGYDEPNVTTTADGTKLLGELSALSPAPVYIRTHNLLNSGDGTYSLKWGSTNAYSEDASGAPIYNWKIMDSIFDAIVSRGMKPIAEIGFMPEALSAHPVPYRHHWQPGMPYDKIYTGWAYPPTDYAKWAGLVYRWVTHAVKRYGKTEVESWYWEVWNEPNIGYWQGSPAQYRELYDYTADAVKRACPGARVGGPASTGPGWDKAALFLKAFLAHCDSGRNAVTGRKGAPLDFISFHAKGSPRIVKGQVRMNLATELRDVQSGFRIIAASRFKKLPVLVTEFDPEGCAACGMTTNPENAYRNGTMYSSYTAATFCRLYDLALRYGVSLKRATSWSFEFEGQRWFDGFRSLATHGIDKPVLNVFRMYGMMAGDRLGVVNARALPMDSLLASSVHGTTPDVHALATEGKNQTSVMIWNYSDEQAPRQPAMVHLSIKNIPAAKVLLLHFRIDQDHSNAYTAWKRMGSPQQVTPRQYRVLERTGQLQLLRSPRWIKTKDGTAEFSFSLPGEGISLLRLEYQNND